MAGCEAVIHLIGIIREFPARGVTFARLHVQATSNVLAEARRQGIGRYLHMSANGTRPGSSSGYFSSKWQAEEVVRASGLDWTIFRPSLIHGEGDQFINLLAKLIRILPLVPVIGNGQYQLAPVFVKDVAAAFSRGLTLPASQGKTFPCCGPQAYTYDQVLDLIGQTLGRRRVRKIHQPVMLVRPAVSLFESFSLFPITGDQLSMLLEGNVCENHEWASIFNIAPAPLPAAMASYLR
jgi:NADH dehydrogenase